MSRLEYWKQRDLDEKEAKAIGDIEQYDCHVIQVAGGDGSPAFSYSLGLYAFAIKATTFPLSP